MLIDTDVLIWYLRGNERAAKVIDSGNPFAISAVTYMELVQGMRDKAELRALRAALRQWRAPVLQIDESVSSRAMFYVERHFLSGAVRMADALIGATAAGHGMTLLTGNTKHYKPLADVDLKLFRP